MEDLGLYDVIMSFALARMNQSKQTTRSPIAF